tara:strand:- start:59 stop:754 length:696 start_codon:yes stop_codon:yes gene_type:complete
MIVIASVVLLLILVGVLVTLYFMSKGDDTKTETIIIGGEEEQTGGTEGYVMMANKNVPLEVSPYNLYAYNPNSTSDPNMGGVDIFNEDDGKCPDGTLDCLYFEKVTNGRVTDITDKDGNKMVQQFVDDFYDGKLPLLDQLFEDKPQILETLKLSEDNKLMELKVTPPESEGETETTSWVKIKPGIDKPVGQYLIITMALYKVTGKPKPNVVIDLPAVEREGPTQDIERPAE